MSTQTQPPALGPDQVPPPVRAARRRPGRLGAPDSRPDGSLLLKIAVLGVLVALGLYAVLALAIQGRYVPATLLALGTAAMTWIYGGRRRVPAKYLAPGLAFLLVYQVYAVLYTGYAAMTNYGDAHNSSKPDAVAVILAASETRVEGSASYRVSVVSDGTGLGLLVTDPRSGSVRVGTADQPLTDVEPTATDATGRASAAGEWRSVPFAELVDRQAEVTALRVPLSTDPEEGSVRTQDGSTGYVYRSTLTYDDSAGVLRGSDGTVYADDGNGSFVGPDGRVLEPGWKVFVGADNFTRVLTEPAIRGPFLGVLVWTFAFAIGSVLLSFALGLGLAMALDDDRLRFKRTYRSMLLLPYAFPPFLAAILWAGMLNQDFGFVNATLLGGADIAWLSDPWLAKLSVLVFNVWLGFPYMFLVSTGALQAIPGQQLEAARLDGAGAWRILRSVKMPLLLVSLAPLLISSFAFNSNNFNVVYMLTGGGPRDLSAPVDVGSTDILITFVYKLAFGGANRQYGFACAVSILIFVIVATISAISFRRTRSLEDVH